MEWYTEVSAKPSLPIQPMGLDLSRAAGREQPGPKVNYKYSGKCIVRCSCGDATSIDMALISGR